MLRALLLVLLVSMQSLAAAQDCPGPQKLVVGLAAGGGNDGVARLLANQVAARFNRPVIVENRVGATGNIAAEYVARATKDGCTLALRSSEHNVSPLIYARAGYQASDFAPVTLVARGPGVIVADAGQPFKTLAAMVEYAKANPGKLTYSSSGIGGGNHLAAEAFIRAAGIQLLHVPFNGAAPAMQALVSGTVALSVGSIAPVIPFIRSGKAIPLAVTGPTRWPSLPDVPTLAEAGYGEATVVYWMGIFAPAGTPRPVLEALNRDYRSAVQDPPVAERVLALGFEPVGGSSQEFEAFLEKDAAFYRRLVQQLNIRIE